MASFDINLGMDHRCLLLHLQISFCRVSRAVRKPRSFALKGWIPEDADKFISVTNEASQEQDHNLEKSLEHRCLAIEDLLLKLGPDFQQNDPDVPQGSSRPSHLSFMI